MLQSCLLFFFQIHKNGPERFLLGIICTFKIVYLVVGYVVADPFQDSVFEFFKFNSYSGASGILSNKIITRLFGGHFFSNHDTPATRTPDNSGERVLNSTATFYRSGHGRVYRDLPRYIQDVFLLLKYNHLPSDGWLRFFHLQLLFAIFDNSNVTFLYLLGLK